MKSLRITRCLLVQRVLCLRMHLYIFWSLWNDYIDPCGPTSHKWLPTVSEHIGLIWHFGWSLTWSSAVIHFSIHPKELFISTNHDTRGPPYVRFSEHSFPSPLHHSWEAARRMTRRRKRQGATIKLSSFFSFTRRSTHCPQTKRTGYRSDQDLIKTKTGKQVIGITVLISNSNLKFPFFRIVPHFPWLALGTTGNV